MKPFELLKLNLPLEADLQNFASCVMESVPKLGGNPFSAALGMLALMEKLRHAGAGTGFPLAASFFHDTCSIYVSWGEKNERQEIAGLADLPSQDALAALRTELLKATQSLDPSLLLERNIEMERHFEEARARAEQELQVLQRTLQLRQAELENSLRLAETDPLTGLLNRRAFDDRIKKAYRRTMRQKDCSLTLLLFDLDHFKKVNDQFGHQEGDAYLKKMAQTLRNTSREDVDFIFRFGGDEFAMLIFADHFLALEKAEQVLSMMDRKVSVGLSAIHPGAPVELSLEHFIQRADAALYEAKRSGRGRAVLDPALSNHV